MSPSQFLLEYRQKLRRNGLPSAYVSRTVQEMSDHLEDLKENGRDWEQIGNPGQLSLLTIESYRQNTTAGRHPVATIVLASLLLLPVIWVGYIMSVVFVVFQVMPLFQSDWLAKPLSETTITVTKWLSYSAMFIPFIIAAWAGARLTASLGRGPLLGLLIVCMQMFVAMCSVLYVEAPLLPTDQGHFLACIGFPLQSLITQNPALCVSFTQQLTQLTIVGCTGLTFLALNYLPGMDRNNGSLKTAQNN